jgi:hypothetical protein
LHGGRLRLGPREPTHVFASAKRMARAAWESRGWFFRGYRKYRNDDRYDLSAVARGFQERVEHDAGVDEALLLRICRSYSMAVAAQRAAPVVYQPTAWWQQRDLMLAPLMRALAEQDIPALQQMYANFFRDDCATGLVPVQRMKGGYFGSDTAKFYQRLYLIDALFRLDYWKAQTGGQYSVRDLAGPAVGNPFGVVVDETLVRSGAEYQHYSAQRVAKLLPMGAAVAAEIGGGFGGMAYYLLRDRPGTTYIDFDVPESIALTSYYLMRALPDLHFVLYGESEITAATIQQADVLLLPACAMATVPDQVADVSFSSHAVSDLSADAMPEYTAQIARMTRRQFLYVGHAQAARAISVNGKARGDGGMTLLNTRASHWNSHIAPESSHVECLYQVEASPVELMGDAQRPALLDEAMMREEISW